MGTIGTSTHLVFQAPGPGYAEFLPGLAAGPMQGTGVR